MTLKIDARRVMQREEYILQVVFDILARMDTTFVVGNLHSYSNYSGALTIRLTKDESSLCFGRREFEVQAVQKTVRRQQTIKYIVGLDNVELNK